MRVQTLATPVETPSPQHDLSRREYVRALRRITLLMVVLGLFARVVKYAIGSAIWSDEAAVGLNVVNRDYEGLTHALDWRQVAPVFFLWAERAAVVTLGASEWAVRFVPFLFGIAGLLVFWDMARRVVQPTAATIAVSVLAVSRWPVFMSGTLKPYSGDLFWSVVLMALAARWRQRPDRLWPLAVLALTVPTAIGFSYPTVFVAGAVAIYLLPAVWRSGDRRVWILFNLYGMLLIGSFVAILMLVQSQQADPQSADLASFMSDYWAEGFPPGEPWTFLKWVVFTHTGRLMMFPIGDVNGGSTITFLLFLAGTVAGWRSGNRSLVALCLVPFVLNFAAAVLHKYPYGASCRLVQHFAPAICLLVGVGAAAILEWAAPRLGTRLGRVRLIAFLLALFGFASVCMDFYKPNYAWVGGWSQRIERELRRHVRSGDIIVYRRQPDAVHEPFEWYMTRFGDCLKREHVPDLTADTRRVWLVVLVNHRSGAPEEAECVTQLGPGWHTLARAEYVLQPNPRVPNFVHCTVRCFGRTDTPGDRPILQASP